MDIHVYTRYIHPVGYTWYIHGYTWISQGYRSGRHIHGIYLEYSMYIHEIGVPDERSNSSSANLIFLECRIRSAAERRMCSAQVDPYDLDIRVGMAVGWLVIGTLLPG